MSVFLQASAGGSLCVDQGRRSACPFAPAAAAGRVCSVSAQAPAWQTLQGQQSLRWAAASPSRTWQARASYKRQKHVEDNDLDLALPDFEDIDREELQAFLDLELESDYDLDDSRHYEIMFLVPEHEVEKVPDVIRKVEAFVAEQKGRVWRVNDWGLRRLAYKIKKASKANYVLMNIEIKAQAINQLNTLFEKDERVIRHMCMTQKEAVTAVTTPPPNYYPEEGAAAAEADDEEDDDEEDDDEEDREVDSELDSSEDEGDEVIEGQGRFVAL